VPPRNKHQMHGERGPIARSVTRWRWLLGGESGGWGSAAGVFGSEEWRGFRAAWMDGRVVSYQGRAGSCGSTTSRGTAVGEGWRRWGGEARRGKVRRKRGSSGLVLPAPTGGWRWWFGVIDMPCRRQCHTPRHEHVHCASATTTT